MYSLFSVIHFRFIKASKVQLVFIKHKNVSITLHQFLMEKNFNYCYSLKHIIIGKHKKEHLFCEHVQFPFLRQLCAYIFPRLQSSRTAGTSPLIQTEIDHSKLGPVSHAYNPGTQKNEAGSVSEHGLPSALKVCLQ